MEEEAEGKAALVRVHRTQKNMLRVYPVRAVRAEVEAGVVRELVIGYGPCVAMGESAAES